MSILILLSLEICLHGVVLSADNENVPVVTLDESIKFMEENGGPSMATKDDFQRLQEAISRKIGQDTPTLRVVANNNTFESEKSGNRGGSILEVNRNNNILNRLYQGDILLTKKQIDEMVAEVSNNSTRTRRQAGPKTVRWRGNVHYFFAPGVDAVTKAVFTRAVRFFRTHTCINFVQTSKPINKIRVIKGDGCYSLVGKAGGIQDLSLGEGCGIFGTAVHELAHALGVEHQHSRSDRDQFIALQLANIDPEEVAQFEKLTAANSFNMGIPYDYGSVMQYDAYSFSSNGKVTMVAKQGRYQDTMGSELVSFYDLKLMNTYYGCHAQCRTVKTKCANGGYLNPRTCAECICPDGFGGTICNQRPSGCGSVLQATNTFKALRNTLGNGLEIDQPSFAKCHFLLQAPKGKRIIVVGQNFEGYGDAGCKFSGVEIKSQANRQKTGYRFCTTKGLKKTFLSHDNVVPIITYNRYSRSTVRLAYRIAPSAKVLTGNLNITEEETEEGEKEQMETFPSFL